jgi:hypothetical protein
MIKVPSLRLRLCVGHGFEAQGETVNICTNFNLSNETSYITNMNKQLPFIYITSPASPASSKN